MTGPSQSFGQPRVCRVGHGLPDTLTLNEKKRPTVALALDGLMKWGATAGIPTGGGWSLAGGSKRSWEPEGPWSRRGPPDAEVRLVDGAPSSLPVWSSSSPLCRWENRTASTPRQWCRQGPRRCASWPSGTPAPRARRGLGLVGVLDVEDRLARLHERLEGRALLVLPALLVHGAVGERFNVGDKTVAIDVVLQKPSHTETVDDAGHLGHESELVGHRQGEAGAVAYVSSRSVSTPSKPSSLHN